MREAEQRARQRARQRERGGEREAGGERETEGESDKAGTPILPVRPPAPNSHLPIPPHPTTHQQIHPAPLHTEHTPHIAVRRSPSYPLPSEQKRRPARAAQLCLRLRPRRVALPAQGAVRERRGCGRCISCLVLQMLLYWSVCRQWLTPSAPHLGSLRDLVSGGEPVSGVAAVSTAAPGAPPRAA